MDTTELAEHLGGDAAMDIDGLPLHVLLVHAVVVLIPLAALVAVLSVWPTASRRLGALPPLLAAVPVLLVPVNVEAGEWLLARVPPTEQVLLHADLGKTLLPWSIAVFVTCSFRWWWHRYTDTATPSTPRPRLRSVMSALTAVAVVTASIGSVVTVVRIGESGTAAVWRDAYSPDPITE